MTQRSYELQLTHQELTTILENMLSITKTHKPLHPSPERSKYANLFDWLVTAATSLKRRPAAPKDLAQQQQQLITSALTQMIELTRKQCVEKSMVLEIVLEYLLSTLNGYWQAFENASKEISYEYQHNAVKIEKEYISEIKRLQSQNQELRRDKEHRWRNMFMLTKDNRVYRRKNKKLMKAIAHELDKSRLMAEQIITQQSENEKIKTKLDLLQEDTCDLEHYLETTIKLAELEKKAKKYPSRCKKMLKNDLINVEIGQIKNINDKINFIIKAVEQTGEIIQEIYDQDVVFTNFHYNISTQTDNHTDDKAVNTAVVRSSACDTQTYARQHAALTHCDTLELRVRGLKAEKKDSSNRDSKNVMFMSQSLSRFNQQKKEERFKSRNTSKRDNIGNFALCEAIKITIYQARICYISTYNTEIFNGIELNKHSDQKEDNQLEFEVAERMEMEVQTDPLPAFQQPVTNSFAVLNRNINIQQSKINIAETVMLENKRLLALKMQHFQVSHEVLFCFDPSRRNKGKQQIKMKIVQNHEKEICHIKQFDSELCIESETYTQKVDKPIKVSPMSSKVTIKKTTKNQQWKRPQMPQQEDQIYVNNLQELKKCQNYSVQTQTYAMFKSPIKGAEDYAKESQSSINSRNTTIKAIQSINCEGSEQSSPIATKTSKKQVKMKQFNKSLNSLITSKVQVAKQPRNKSSILSLQQLKNLQSYRASKLKETGHKRTVTQQNELIQPHKQLTKTSQNYKGKPLHRISQDIRQVQHFGDQIKLQTRFRSKDKSLMPMPFVVNKEGDFVLKDMDFSKSLEKILKNMDVRRQEILNNQLTLKSYLVSYFKCHYGRQLYQSFINFLINSSQQHQELIICFNKLTNSKLPEPYLMDLFKTFIVMLKKCYMVNESLTSHRIRLDLLISMVNMYYEEDESKRFAAKMNTLNVHNFSGWFICLEDELRIKVICSGLYHFLSQILIQSEDSITYNFIEELAYFIPSEETQIKNLMRCKTLLGKKTAIHRFALFCLKYQWRKMLAIQQTIEHEYLKVLGLFSYQKSLFNIEANMKILSEFKNLHKCIKYWLSMRERYRSEVNIHLVMVCELLVTEYRMKVDFPISKELRFINLACQGLQKKLLHQELTEATEDKESGRNYSLY